MRSFLVKFPGAGAQKIAVAANEKYTLHIYLLLLILAVLIIVVGALVIFIQWHKLKAREMMIEEKNALLDQINEKLNDQEQVKEKYIGHFFSIIADYITRLEKLKRGVERKIIVKKYDDIMLSFNEINIKKERENLFVTFDSAFLKIFPNFINDFNALLKKEDQMWLPKPDTLTKELRIFALMRLGISDCKTMAGILEYSTNTIYVYKMRVKAKSVFVGDQFDQKLMTIRAANREDLPPLQKSA